MVHLIELFFFNNVNCRSFLEFVDYSTLENTFAEHSFSMILAFKWDVEDEGRNAYVYFFLLLLATRKCTTVTKFLTFCA